MGIHAWNNTTWSNRIDKVYYWNGSSWVNANGMWYWNGSTWVKSYSNEIQTWATIKISKIGSYQGTKDSDPVSGNWTQAGAELRQGAYSTTGWYGGVMLLERPTVGSGVVTVSDYNLTVNRLALGSHSSSNTISWRGVNATAIGGDRPTWSTSGSICDMTISGSTGKKSTVTGGLEKDAAFKDVLKAWLNGSFANIGIYAGMKKPNSAYLGLNSVELDVLYTYTPN